MTKRSQRVRMADVLFRMAPKLYDQALNLGRIGLETGVDRRDVYDHKRRIDGDGGTSALVELGLRSLMEQAPDTRRERPLP